MAKYRKRPVVIDAWPWPECPPDAMALRRADGTQQINTLEGPMIRSPGDWLIRGVAGEFYPCKPGIFEETYEALTPEEGAWMIYL